jgi:hypothetical protein
MPRHSSLVFIFIFAFLFLTFLAALTFPTAGSAQTGSDRPFSRFGIAIKASLLGAGLEAATPLTARSDLRAGFNVFSYDHTFKEDGVAYAGQLRFRSVEAHYDWFPFHGGFHLSPGVLLYNGNQITANSSVPAGNTFTLNNTTYVSDPSDPISGAGKVEFVKAGPMFTVGWGSLLPHNRHFSFPFELGVIYTGAPRTAINMRGSACDSIGQNCLDITSNSAFQSNVQAEQNKLNKDMSAFKFYPVISAGFGVNF